jgi:dolichol-phosphate mannosyltransferase
MFISIIIPIKEEPSIQKLIDKIDETIGQKHEIIIVDKSQYFSKIEGAKVMAQKSDGLGNAFVEGLSNSKGDIIVLMDGDGSHRPEDLLRMLSKIDEYDIILGSKLARGGTNNDTLGRRMVTLSLAWLTRLVLWIDIKDPLTGFMVAKRDVFKNIELKPRGFKIVTEIIYKSRANVLEIPILFQERESGSSKAGFNTNGIRELFRIIILLIELKSGRILGN